MTISLLDMHQTSSGLASGRYFNAAAYTLYMVHLHCSLLLHLHRCMKLTEQTPSDLHLPFGVSRFDASTAIHSAVHHMCLGIESP